MKQESIINEDVLSRERGLMVARFQSSVCLKRRMIMQVYTYFIN